MTTSKNRLIELYDTLFFSNRINSKSDFAEKLGVSKQYVSTILKKGNQKVPSNKILKQAIIVFELPQDYFLESAHTNPIEEMVVSSQKEPNALYLENQKLKAEIMSLKDEIIRLQKHIIKSAIGKNVIGRS